MTSKEDRTRSYRTQLQAAYELLTEDTASLEKLEKLKTLLSGINPSLDKKLDRVFGTYGHLKAAWKGDVIHLSAHGLAETTPEDKRRKKLLLLFIGSWGSLKSEVKRVQGYYSQSSADPIGKTAAASTAKTLFFAKGPFGLITGLAVLVVGAGLLLPKIITDISIENRGCPPMTVPTELPINIPGLHLPSSPIVAGTPGIASLPGIPLTVTADSSRLTARALGQSGTYYLPSGTVDVSFDGTSLLNRTTDLRLGSSPKHTLVISCR